MLYQVMYLCSSVVFEYCKSAVVIVIKTKLREKKTLLVKPKDKLIAKIKISGLRPCFQWRISTCNISRNTKVLIINSTFLILHLLLLPVLGSR